jgi:putative transcriptional regulator
MENKTSDDYLELTKNIKHLRLAAGWSQDDLAKRVGVTRQTITAIETNKQIPSKALVLGIMGLFMFGMMINPILASIIKGLELDKVFERMFKSGE